MEVQGSAEVLAREPAPRAEPVLVQEFPRLTGAEMEKFLRTRAKLLRLELQSAAWKFLLRYALSQAESSSAGLQELQKISLASFEQPISLSDVQKILAFNAYDESFAIALQLLRARDVSGRLLALSLLLFRGDEARYTFNLLGSLARGREAVLLAEYDEKIKGGEMDDETSLLGFALGV